MSDRQTLRATCASRVQSFTRDESGVVAPLMLVFFFLMLLIGGLAVDLMRFETKRVALQQTMDRATLAAASLENSLAPEDVVRSYMDTSGVDGVLDNVRVVTAMNARIVEARASVRSKNYFMSMMETPHLDANNRSEAEQRITNVEISLVLDISGSMDTGSKIANLKSAASEFIDTVLANDNENKISISIVPYNGQVNIGPTLFSKFNVVARHGNTGTRANSYCLDLPSSTFATTELSRTTPLPQTPFVDHWSSVDRPNSSTDAVKPEPDDDGLYVNMWCQPNAATYVMVHENDPAKLKAHINNLIAVGATSIDLGMKWGMLFLDPSSRSITEEMARGGGPVPTYFADRPAQFRDPETLKIIVLMTDGENFQKEETNDLYRAGPSPIWRSTSRGNPWSVFHASRVNNGVNDDADDLCRSKPYYVPSLNAWHSRPYNGTTPANSECYQVSTSTADTSDLATRARIGANRLNWQDVWAEARSDWVAWQLYGRALGGTSSSSRTSHYNTWKANFRSFTQPAEMNTRLNQMCSAAKAQGVWIYGIAFEAPQGGATAIRRCATGREGQSAEEGTYYFDASGLEIRTAFRAIASNLSQLRLTQ
ncbi:pilus assembly protein [Xinfangfangia sp. CPCC 101601]|uniref:Pilus assembly protein n=1 Tax=Pseudogemmobacter lacusdianii TaxID=3069608 RepID=A0ABU0VVF2_9RHOB|nr:TadE/TadG family type IV pilus assembly protein [Xinfangfangia sp. CPCC 101601]MDQ2065712.1 pilus assembly protein [Xinfangfangia sp. CPCC 101601]